MAVIVTVMTPLRRPTAAAAAATIAHVGMLALSRRTRQRHRGAPAVPRSPLGSECLTCTEFVMPRVPRMHTPLPISDRAR